MKNKRKGRVIRVWDSTYEILTKLRENFEQKGEYFPLCLLIHKAVMLLRESELKGGEKVE